MEHRGPGGEAFGAGGHVSPVRSVDTGDEAVAEAAAAT